MIRKPRILLIGPVTNLSGYSEHARLLLDSLIDLGDKIELFVINTQWAASTINYKYLEKYKNLIDKTSSFLETKKNNQGQIIVAGVFDISYQIRPPNEFQLLSPHDIGVTAALETTFAPSEWVPKCNIMKHILVVSEHARKNLKNAKGPKGEKITTPITVAPFAYDDSIEKECIYDQINLSTKFNFLSVMQMAPRKNFENLIKWFVEEFENDPEVGLVLKTQIQNNSTIDYHNTKQRLISLINNFKPNKKCKIYLIHGSLKEEEIQSLYNPDKINCYITTTHGEGFGIPIFNAACNGIPIIATNWSGHLDYLRVPTKNRAGKKKIKSHFMKVDYDLAMVQENHLMPGLITRECIWAYPKEASFKKNLRTIRTNSKLLDFNVDDLQNHLIRNYSLPVVLSMYTQFHELMIKEVTKRFDEEMVSDQEEEVDGFLE